VSIRTKRWVKLFALTSLIAFVVIALVQREPSARGHPLSHWLSLATDPSANKSTATNADAAIKEIGVNAIPTLLDKLTTDDKLRTPIARCWNKALAAIFSFRGYEPFGMNEHRASDHHEQATHGFEIMGSNAANAVPALKILSQDERHAYDAAICLGYIKTDEALQVLIPLLSNTNSAIRQRVISELVAFDDRALIAAEKIVQLRDDPEEGVARNAVAFIAYFLPTERAIPLLTEKFHDQRPGVVRGAVGAFFWGGPVAEPVMPAIAQVFQNPDEESRMIATNTLITINPYRAVEFGVNTNGVPEHYFKIYQRALEQDATNKTGRLPR
jgi:HEAT repeat protein